MKTIKTIISKIRLIRPISLITLIGLITLSPMTADAQIKIGGNVYGGGNHAEVRGSTKVTVKAGDIGAVLDPDSALQKTNPRGRVFGGARMANVGGNSFVHIDGENATDYIVINQVFGGNDIAGTIGTAAAVGESLPTELSGNPDGVDNTWNSYVHLSTKTTAAVTYTAAEATAYNTAHGLSEGDPGYKTEESIKTPVAAAGDAKQVFIGQLFAGGNGDFDYEQTPGPGVNEVTHTIYNRNDESHTPLATLVTPEGEVGFVLPETEKTYLDIQGGTIAFAYGGGSNATVKEKTVIHLDNPSDVVTQIYVNKLTRAEVAKASATDSVLTDARIKYGMGIRMAQEKIESDEFQIGRLFGGNNVAEMSIRPTWNLQLGKVRNLYSGGNRGNMTSPEGLLLEINPKVPDGLTYEEEQEIKHKLVIDNVYGGCRMADVIPTVNGVYTPCTNLQDKDGEGNLIYHFPNELAARTLIRGGDINNVYGGNDVTGTVYGGNAVGVYTTVRGDIYGGGNGGYAYTDLESYKDDEDYGDFYYNSDGYASSAVALNDFRPNAEQVSVRLSGTDATHPTIIRGSVYVGGNCASLATKKNNPLVELKIGSHVIAENVFLGNNGAKMIDPDVLELYGGNSYSSLTLTDPSEFAEYMDGVVMTLKPDIVFDNSEIGDPVDYLPYSSYVGSFYCGGNVGGMAIEGKTTYTVDKGLNIYNKFVGGCNNADVAAGTYNAAYEGGVLGAKNERGATSSTFYTDTGAENGKIKDRLEINLENLTITPLRWDNTNTRLIWNTQKLDDTGNYVPVDNSVAYGYNAVPNGTTLTKGETYYRSNTGTGEFISDGTEVSNGSNYFVREHDVRLLGGNIYGGCYNSGHVNGNIVININEDVLKRDEVFGDGVGPYGRRASGVDLLDQRDDLDAVALILFGGGYGENTEVWGSTTVNHNNGYVFQICGGGERGVVGKKTKITGEGGVETEEYKFNAAYSSTVNLQGTVTANSNEGAVEDLAETEYIYGGGKEGDVCGNTLVNLGNGRIYDAFAGACEANILGHSEVYIGRQPNGSGGYKDAFPWIQDNIYGGNDYCGTIYGEYEDNYNFEARLRDYDTDKTQIHGYKSGKIPDVLKSSTYVEYLQGRVDTIFGGGYGYYDYQDEELYGTDASMPVQHSSFVNIRPKNNSLNHIRSVFGGATGFPGIRENDGAQDRSYVLIDIPDGMTYFSNMEVFGSGSYNGLGMKFTYDEETGKTVDESGTAINLDEASAIIDLLRGRIHNVYGGSFNEGITRRTIVNVPSASSIQIDNIFGGAYGTQILPPCDVYETQVNYKNTSENAQVFGAIYGGNNNERRSLFTQVNISSPVWQNKTKGYTGTVFGAGHGIDTWSEHTEVNLLSGAKVYNVYGGGELGHVLNSASIQAYQDLYKTKPSPQISADDPKWSNPARWTGGVGEGELIEGKLDPSDAKTVKEEWIEDWKDAWTVGSYYAPNGDWDDYATNPATSFAHVSERAELDDKTAAQLDGKKYNTNVIINEGAIVEGYAYGGGLGDASVALSGDIYGSSYVAVLGGEVQRDVYAGGRAGGLDNLFGATSFSGGAFTASANAYIQGGTARNVYGGGYLGHVGHHTGDITTDYSDDRLAKANVVIGKVGTNTFAGGAPAITRNVYGGGEGGSVYGTSRITVNNGYIGYRYKNTGTNESPKYEYVEELDDQKPNDIDAAGNVFGGGYVINSYVDNTNINMYGGQVRGSLFGGGEVGPIGRGALQTGLDRGIENGDATIFKAGTTQVNMYDGKVLRNVFGGGRGEDSWGGDGTLYMEKATVDALKANGLMCKGYVFGQTRVNIYGGEIGTEEGMAYGYGNVFGGCDEGTVYSALEIDGNLRIGHKNGERYVDATQGYYFLHDGTNYIMNNGDYIFTEDCNVLVEPHCQAYVDIPGTSYKAGDYVPTSYLNTLKNKTADAAIWNNLDPDGIIIHNAVFAGGNIAAGSSSLYANSKTVFGNASASIHDVYNRDLITIGTGHTGGLYGDGNLTFVDGYRELNITNYGTDYYHITHHLDYDKYKILPEREKAYYELKYKCLIACTDIESTNYSVGSELPQDELLVLFTDANGKSLLVGTDSIIVTVAGKKVPNSKIWQENGVVSVYAGRIMNTIQRADFCGVFGSRMVMKGAQDRVPEEVDYTNYTINRVREVSLNKKISQAGDTGENAIHGNYFGIYSVVNYLGALTSDVRMDTIRTTNADLTVYPNLKPDAEDPETFYEWKAKHKSDKTRNNGTCHNHLALASGVYLELTSEEKTGKTLDTKEWGPITGVVELDLINVQPGIGGGFVYAKNIHGVPKDMRETRKTTTMSALNKGAATQWNFDYIETNDELTGDDANQVEWQTSGNFIHSSQTIIDDCYNIGNKYLMGNRVPAHYWFISGSVYVYDQYISAYTGVPNAFSETVEMPITLNAASNGTMTLMDVRPNLYAYYSAYNSELTNTKLEDNQKMVINNVTYHLNDPINYWEWNKLTSAEKKLFVADTYVLKDSCYINSKYYPAGYVMLPSEYSSLNRYAVDHVIDGKTVKAVKKSTKNAEGEDVVAKDSHGDDIYVAFDDAFRSSNNMSHDTGYLLTYNVTNPGVWNQWYTMINSSEGEKNQTGGTGYEDAPTYRLKEDITSGMLLGQRDYSVNDIISKNVYKAYAGFDEDGNGSITGDERGLDQLHHDAIPTDDAHKQATFVPAHLVTTECTYAGQHYYPGAPVAEIIDDHTAPAYICTATIQLSPTEYIYVNDLMTEDQKTAYYNRFHKDGATAAEEAIATEINELVVPAYYCTGAGLYGGSYYEVGKNYRALEAYSAMSPADRAYLDFNYDALDLLIDPAYGKKLDGTQQAQGKKYQYDGMPYDWTIPTILPTDTEEQKAEKQAEIDRMIYSLSKPIDYTATYNGTTDEISHNGITRTNGTEYTREQYESLPNEQRHYAPIKVEPADVGNPIYVVNTSFVHVETPYAVGATLDSDAYGRLSTDEKNNITTLTFSSGDMNKDEGDNIVTTTFYYCRESYKVGEKSEGVTVTKCKGEGSESYTSGNEVPVGFVINATNYASLKNYQKDFTIHGISPMETSTLYISRNSDFNDLTKEKIITVIYKYDYEESDADGMHITPVSERHVVNIHITFKSGVPIVDDINAPSIVLPGTGITMRTPSVTPGAYEITGGGWELFEKPSDAESHVNGVEYTPNSDPLYWYQDGFYLAYYAKTYLGKTYSNHVPVSVANYHDLKRVMDDKTNHLHIDYDRTRLKRDSKIYINDYSGSSQNGLDLFKDLYDLSLVSETGGGYTVTDGKISAATGTANTHLVDHALLNNSMATGTNIYDGQTYTKGVKAGKNLEFILRTDIDHPTSWTSIGSDDDEACFKGNLHGDGHTISGLNNSLFNNLCGNVYNLGVRGSFTSAGVADNGPGYVESAWINTTGTPDGSVRAIFGNPNAASDYKQIVNSYYQTGKNYSTTDTGNHGLATAMSDNAFYNGEVAYNLNNFYLYKRYSDQKVNSGVEYKYYKSDVTDPETGKLIPQTGYYASNADLCSSGYNNIKYVEERFADGDFIFAAGEIPTSDDERHWVDTEDDDKSYYFPIWPDDYIFFGQKLTYGWADEAHQDVPTAVVRDDGRLSLNDDANRVYRAPAYYRSKDMGVTHFNPNVYLAQKSYDGTKTAYPGMTAIDFKGHNDLGYQLGLNDGWFYTPLLDDDGLTSIVNCDETQNLLVYAPSSDANAQTLGVLNGYFADPIYTSHFDNSEGYKLVSEATYSDVHGHLVDHDLIATNDHLLVDMQDFNAPIAYSFDADHLMWYQRIPANNEYVDHKNGWQGISVPFTAELVTTNQKGEITHFYSGSDVSQNGTKKGHEYWLREFTNIVEEGTGLDLVARGTFSYPLAEGETKNVTNDFLWDYYYKNERVHNQLDAHADTYLQYRTYYKENRTYPAYPLLKAATPYILGLPGQTYYEFDLSGKFEAQNTKATITKLGKQVITLASNKGIHIGVSDDEMSGKVVRYNSTDYTFKPSYMNMTLGNGNYVMNSDGNAYVKLSDVAATWNTTSEVHTFADAAALTSWMTSNYKLYTDADGTTEATTASGSEVTYYKRTTVKTTQNEKNSVSTSQSAFRPYFTIPGAGSLARSMNRFYAKKIVFDNTSGEFGEGPETVLDGSLEIYTRGYKIFTTSHMKEATTIRIVNASGATITNYVLQPGETIETPVAISGVYVVNKKKVFVE